MTASAHKQRPPVFGFLAEFDTVDDLVAAIRRARTHGYQRMEAYTPMPVEEVIEELGHGNRLPLVVLVGGIFGGVLGFAMQYYASTVDYPINVGGRPFNSWQSYIVITFEMTILFAALSAVLGMLALNGLPQPYHPVFNVPSFALASRNRFFLLIMGKDPQFDMQKTRELLQGTECLVVAEVPY
ncbi:MAG: DUF3341 domain-containing protein [Planctomycetota bacterium]